ncbi:MAG: glycoside hydrolase family protein [Saccharofermentanales bacterium]
MKYKPAGTFMWDPWFINVEGRIHAFHLKLSSDDCSLPPEERFAVGHIYSDDLIHWSALPSILPPLYDLDEKDYHQKFTGCAAQIDGKYIVYYTMRDKAKGNQRLGAAISYDMNEFIRYDGNPVIVPDDSFKKGDSTLIGYRNIADYDWAMVDCRDLVVVKCEADGLYYGYFAVAADVGREHPVGVIAVAVSNDLLNWRDQSIVYVPRQNGLIEVPDVYEIGGKWYLTTLCGTRYIGRDIGNDEYSINCTTYSVADNPRGPFKDGDDNIFISGFLSSGWTCRSVVKDGKRYLFYIDSSFGGSTLSLPKEIRVDEKGRLGAYYADILKNIRKKKLISADDLPEPSKNMLVTNSNWYRTFGGSWVKSAGRYIGSTGEHDYQAIDLQRGAPSIEANAIFIIDAFAAGFFIHSGNPGLEYVISLEPAKNRILLLKMYTFEILNARSYVFTEGRAYDVKLILIEGVCELYIDKKLIIQCGIQMGENTSVGLFCDRGDVVVENLVLYEIGDQL